ncbi:MAG TPA: class III lanthionine synthetase LanKC [Rugosimonospora sp.]
MSEGYEAFCVAHPLFYDALHSESTAGTTFPTAGRPLPDGWRREEQSDWLVFAPSTVDLPMQGWKIHVSSTLPGAGRILDAVWDYCVPRGIEFKFLRSEMALWLRSSKYAPRGYSGKLVTIYPHDDGDCERILRELGAILDGEPGPYILSDLRWGDGPLHVRYGGFAPRHCVDESGQVVLAIADDTGTLVPDRREPVFRVPAWLELPEFLASHLANRNAVTVSDIPYTIESVMHFSNGGGLYRGTAVADGRPIVLKEARPHAGLDGSGADAVTRAAREFDVLGRLAGIPAVPEVYEFFTLGEHRFLAMEFIDGIPLHKALVRRYPMIEVGATPEDYAGYVDWALGVYWQVEAAVLEMHDRGVVYGDLHLFNVLIRADDTVALLDFEVASLVEENARPALGNQAFAAPPTVTGADVDRYALACLRLALFLPITQVLWLARSKVDDLAAVIRERFPVPADFLAYAVEIIRAAEVGRPAVPARPTIPAQPVPVTEPALVTRPAGLPTRDAAPMATPDAALALPDVAPMATPDAAPEAEGGAAPATLDPADWPGIRERLVRAILASATPERVDRLFPGDIEQFRLGGLGLAYGAAGVLYALSVTGSGHHPEHEEWLLRQAKQPPPGTMMGLYDGLHGVAFVLDHLGYRAEALDTLGMCLSDGWESLGLDLIGGLSGIGLNLAHFADRTGDAALRDAADRAADLVAERLGDEESVAQTSGLDHPYAGLMRGSSGPALLLIGAYDRTGDRAYLDRAAVALRQDLRRCVVRDNGVMEVNEGWRTMPYLAFGSAGVGVALDRYLARCPDERFAQAGRAIRRAALSPLYVQPGVFGGRAGMLLYLAGQTGTPGTDPDVLDQLGALSWHAVPFAGGIAFPGDQLLRLSMDLATGTAGVLLAVGAALHGQPVDLPLLPRAGRHGSQAPAPQGRG